MTSAIAISCSPASRRLDGGNVDLLHRHHRLELTSCLSATGRKRIGQRTWRDLPREAPAVLAPTARTFLAAVANDCRVRSAALRLPFPAVPGTNEFSARAE